MAEEDQVLPPILIPEDWHQLTDKASGEISYAASLDGIDLDAFDALSIIGNRCPEGIEEINPEGNIIIPLAALQARAWETVKAIRSAKETGLAPTPLGDVQIDEKSKSKIMGALEFCKLAEETQTPFAMNFTLADNSRVLLNNITVRQLAGAAGSYVSQLYDFSWTLRDAIFAEDVTVDSLDALDLEAGWP